MLTQFPATVKFEEYDAHPDIPSPQFIPNGNIVYSLPEMTLE